MTHETAKWIQKGLYFIIVIVIALIAWFYTRPDEEKKPQVQQTNWIRRIIIPKKPPVAAQAEQKAAASGQGSGVLHHRPLQTQNKLAISASLDEIARKAGKQMPVLKILHFHLPGNPQSEETADHLNQISKRYEKQVLVVRIDVRENPGWAQAEQVTASPTVIMTAGTLPAWKIQGLWPYPRIQSKVDELLHGLLRVGKDWRPEVPGMRPSNRSTP